MSTSLEFRIEWLDAPGVRAPELAATWARYQIWVNGRCVTQVEEPGGMFRQSVFGSLYPLAEWIASNWWFLIGHVRPYFRSSGRQKRPGPSAHCGSPRRGENWYVLMWQ